MTTTTDERQQEQPGQTNASCERIKKTNAKKPNEESKNGSNGIIILGVYIHCQGCENEVRRCLSGFEGVEGIEIDAKNRKVVVKGQKADPIKVMERLRKKTGKHVQLISPINQPKKQVIKEDKQKSQPDQPKVIEVVLKIYMHCEGCVKDVKRCIEYMEGVHNVEPEMAKNLVTVKGIMDPQKLVEFIRKRGGWNATIVKQNPIAKINLKKNVNVEKDSKKEDVIVDREGRKNEIYCYIYPREPLYAPQLFSDENPHSCFIM